jgi:hypothetical protein
MTGETAQREHRPPDAVVPLLSFDDRAARIMTTIWANYVRWLHRAALRAGLKLLGRQAVVRPPHAGSRIRLFTFGNTHRNTCQKERF